MVNVTKLKKNDPVYRVEGLFSIVIRKYYVIAIPSLTVVHCVCAETGGFTIIDPTRLYYTEEEAKVYEITKALNNIANFIKKIDSLMGAK